MMPPSSSSGRRRRRRTLLKVIILGDSGVVCLCYDACEEVIAERKYQLLAFGCAIGWLCSWSLIFLAICLMYIYALSFFVGAYLDAYLDSSRSLEHHIQILLKTEELLDRNKFLIFGFCLGGLSLGFYVGFYVRAIYLTYFLFLYGGKTQSNQNSIWVLIDLILTNLIGSLFLECYQNWIYCGCIVLCICYKLDNPEGSPSKLALWRLMNFISKTEEIWLDPNKFLHFGFYLGGLSLGFYVRGIYLTYFLFLNLFLINWDNLDLIWVSLDSILTNWIGSLFLECYKTWIYCGCIVLWICFKLDNPEGSPSKLALRRLMMLFISEKSKENKGNLPAVDSSAHPQPKDHNAFRPQSSSELLTANTFPQDNQKKTRKPSKVPPIKRKSTRNDSKDESGSSVSARQQDDKQRHRRRHGDDKDDDFLRSCHSADFNSTAAESLQVMAGQNSNASGTQNIRDVNINNFFWK